MRSLAPSRLVLVLAVAITATGVAFSLRSLIGQADVISREVSFSVGRPQQRDVISREVSFTTIPLEPRDVVSREWSFNSGGGRMKDAISREVSFNASEPGSDLHFDPAGTDCPTEGIANQAFQVRWRVHNAGHLPASGPWNDEIRFNIPIRPVSGSPATSFFVPSPSSLAPGASYDQVRSFLMPPNPGDFSVEILADSGGHVGEILENNNRFGPVWVTVGSPNLRIQLTGSPSGSFTAGQFVSLSFRVCNDGSGPTSVPQWTDQVYLGTGTVPSSSGLVPLRSFGNLSFLQNDPGGCGVAPLTFYDRTDESVQIPSTVVGPCYLAVRTDATNAQVESSENDNLAFSTVFQVVEPGRPDLAVQAIRADQSPSTPLLSGYPIVVFWNVANVSPNVDFVGGGTTTQVWISLNSSDSGPTALDGDVLLAQFGESLPPIPRGGGLSGERQREVLAPAHLISGVNYYFKVRIDALDAVMEAESGPPPYWNNLGAHGSYPGVFSGAFDLIARQVEVLPGLQPPQAAHAFQFRWTVENIGLHEWPVSLTWRDEIWLSTDATFNPTQDSLIGSYSQSTVQIGTSWVVSATDVYEKTATFVLPADTERGTYHLILRTDADRNIPELVPGGEENNRTTGLPFLVIRRPADLAIAAQIGGGQQVPPTAGAPGQFITLPWTVINNSSNGTTSVSDWTDGIFLSPSPTSLVGAISIASATHSGVLGPGSSYSQTRTAAVPNVPAGQHWLQFVTDTGGAVFEVGTSANNVAATPFVVTSPGADLVVDQVQASTRVRGGEAVAVNWSVRNAGVGPTATSAWIDTVLLSETPDLAPGSQVHALGSWPRNTALGPNSSYAANAQFSVPQGLAPGAWYVVVSTDAAGQVFEGAETNNIRATGTVLDLEPPPPGTGGEGSPGQGWLPANLVPHNLQVLNNPVFAGQNVELTWELANEGVAATSTQHWSDSVYLSSDAVLDSNDEFIGFYQHASILGSGDLDAVSTTLTIPLWANGTWTVIVKADASGTVYQGGATADDSTSSTTLLQIITPPLTDLDVSSVSVSPGALLGEPLDLAWTTRNDSLTTIPAAWGWTDGFWLIPDGGSEASSLARFLGQISSNAGVITSNGGTHAQASVGLTVPGVPPGSYRIVVRADVLGQIAESDETDNRSESQVVALAAIPLQSGGTATAEIPTGASRWFELTAAQDQTIDLEFTHSDPNARCELFVRSSTPPNLGTYDLASDGVDAIQPNVQRVRIPRTSGSLYYAMARTVSGAGTATSASIQAIVRPFGADQVLPDAVGAGPVTIAIQGAELWRASTVELRGPGVPTASSQETRLLTDGTLLARFNLTSVGTGAREVVIVDGISSVEAPWQGVLSVETPEPLTLRVGIEAPPSIRRGEGGSGILRLENIGNVDIPYALATLGHGYSPVDSSPAEQTRILSPSQGPDSVAQGPGYEGLVEIVEDLRPGGSHDVPVRFEVGGAYALDAAGFGFAGVPVTWPAFLQGIIDDLSHALREALVADSSTPAMLSEVAQSSIAWDEAVSGALGSGAIQLDLGTVHTPESPARTPADLVRAIADGLAVHLALPVGARVPDSAISAASHAGVCSAFAGLEFECTSLFPAGCVGESSRATVSTIQGGAIPLGVACVGTPEPTDPNDKIPPLGHGALNAVRASAPVEYEIHFENVAGASAWASRITITDELEAIFRSSSVRFLELRIGRTIVPFQPGTSNFVGQVPLQVDDTHSAICQIAAVVDISTHTIQVLLQALDPLTGLPNSDGASGLLPPNGPGLEEQSTGYVRFHVLPSDSGSGGPAPLIVTSLSGGRARNTAGLQFNAAPPLRTRTTVNILDDAPPGSSMIVQDVVGSEVHLSWSAVDTEQLASGEFPGTGIKSYTLFVGHASQGPWSPILTDTTDTGYVYSGVQGEALAFKVEAVDHVGNRELKTIADVLVSLEPDCNGNGIPDSDDIAAGTLADANGNGVPDECECTTEAFCDSTADSNGVSARISAVGIPSVSLGMFRLVVEGASPMSRGMFLMGRAGQQAPIGDGYLCVRQGVVRLPMLVTSSNGTASQMLDFNAPPIGSGPQAVSPGSTRYFQFWFRSHVSGSSGNDSSDGLRVIFCD